MNDTHIACPDCAEGSPTRVGELPKVGFFAGRRLSSSLLGGTLYRCNQCDLMYRHPRLNPVGYEHLYNNQVTDTWAMPALRKDQSLVKDYIERQSAARNVMDFGCYTGYFLGALKSDLQKFGVEVNQSAASLAHDKANANVVAHLDHFDREQKFDLIVAMDVIEHFESPSQFVASLLSRLSKNGKILITTGDNRALLWRLVGARWWYSYFPEHIAFVSHNWLKYYAKELGYKVEYCAAFNYLERSLLHRAKSAVSFFIYLAAPSIHALLKQRRLNSEDGDSGVPGAGLSKDHLFIVLSNDLL